MADLLDGAPVAWGAAPTRSAALARIDRVRPAAYARTRNHLEGAVTDTRHARTAARRRTAVNPPSTRARRLEAV